MTPCFNVIIFHRRSEYLRSNTNEIRYRMYKENELLDSRSKDVKITSIESSETGIALAKRHGDIEHGRDGDSNTFSDLRDAPLVEREQDGAEHCRVPA